LSFYSHLFHDTAALESPWPSTSEGDKFIPSRVI